MPKSRSIISWPLVNDMQTQVKMHFFVCFFLVLNYSEHFWWLHMTTFTLDTKWLFVLWASVSFTFSREFIVFAWCLYFFSSKTLGHFTTLENEKILRLFDCQKQRPLVFWLVRCQCFQLTCWARCQPKVAALVLIWVWDATSYKLLI